MGQLINGELLVMEFPIGSKADRTDVVKALFERKQDIENTFKNDEYLKLNLTHQELLGIKSTAYLGDIPIGDRPAINYIIGKTDKYKNCEIIDIGNANMVYNYYSI